MLPRLDKDTRPFKADIIIIIKEIKGDVNNIRQWSA